MSNYKLEEKKHLLERKDELISFLLKYCFFLGEKVEKKKGLAI